MNIHLEIKDLVSKERYYTYEILKKLNELDSTRIYCELGHSSLFEYCTNELKYSEDQAYRRIASARLMQKTPEIKNKIKSGELTLSHLSKASSLFNKINLNQEQKLNFFERLTNTSSNQAEKIICEISPKKEVIEKIKPVQKNLNEIKFYADDQLLENLKKIKSILRKDKLDEVIALLCSDFLKKEAKVPSTLIDQGIPKILKQSRYIPLKTKKEVAKRADNRCEYTTSDGKRCTSTYKLEYAHTVPFAHGGKNTQSNLKLNCKAHNIFDSITIFGMNKMKPYLK